MGSGCVASPKEGSGSVLTNSNKSALLSGVGLPGDVRVWGNKLITSSGFTHVTDGSMFEINARSDILIINGLDVHLHNSGREYVEIWTMDHMSVMNVPRVHGHISVGHMS